MKLPVYCKLCAKWFYLTLNLYLKHLRLNDLAIPATGFEPTNN